jgi:hypothetical protein
VRHRSGIPPLRKGRVLRGRYALGADEIWENHEVNLSCPSRLYGLTRRGSEIFQRIVNALAASVKARF